MDISTGRKRFWFILFSAVAITAVVILASGLRSLDLSYEGGQLPQLPQSEEREELPPPSTRGFELVFRVLLMAAVALLPFAIILYLFSPQARRRLLRDLIALLIVLLPLYLLWRGQPETLESIGDFEVLQAPSEELPPAPDVTLAPQPQQWLSLVVTIGIALLVAGLLVGLGWMIWRRRQRPSPSLDRLAQGAQDAIDAIEEGADLKDTITRCYFEMMQALREHRGIKRQRAMTPREFEVELENLGVPTTQVRRLTRLFEAVRYGEKHLGAEEERQAIVSLTSVVRFCRSGS